MSIATIPRYYVRLVRPHRLEPGQKIMVEVKTLVPLEPMTLNRRTVSRSDWRVVTVDDVEFFGSHVLVNWSYDDERYNRETERFDPRVKYGAIRYDAVEQYAPLVLAWIEGTEKEKRICIENREAKYGIFPRDRFR
ncbi:hypothetical protein [Cronobacter phage JC01]|uniref:Uncharacterized protein n=1 Tax=Cronobacter phage JC01 TaxID=2729575 RepID=A0A6M3YNP4_9CAUD|nr:hypothetical protein JT331_gp76 [Cronobacter phage JC01]QJI52265.1 hypothetical protein [Cronobacter phage JC01]